MRDFGGFDVPGGIVVSDRLFRSRCELVNLDLPAAIDRRRLRCVIDLRSSAEMAVNPFPRVGGAGVSYHAMCLDDALGGSHSRALEFLRLAVAPERRPRVSVRLSRSLVRWAIANAAKSRAARYLTMADDQATVLGQTFEVLAEHAAAPLVICCAAGIDRTGVVVALLLSVLGVSDADVAADYATYDREWLAAELRRMPAQLCVSPADLPEEHLIPFITPPSETIGLFLKGIRTQYGSVSAYVGSRLGLGESGLGVLRTRLVTGG
jgi:protein tyrosine/serine phosphatase